MRSRWLGVVSAFVFACANLAAQYRVALPGYHYQFPRDYFNHPDFQTEWWYYTGNLKSTDGHRLGFELTFFRQGVDRDQSKSGPWDLRDLYFAHLALSDLDGQRFFHAERTNRAGPGIAGASESDRAIWNGNWRASWHGDEQTLEAMTDEIQIHLALQTQKPPVVHGENGVSPKAEGLGHASQYISLTRLLTTGKLVLQGKTLSVNGSSWLDHEFFTHQLTSEQVGWDWLSAQLEDDTELMLFIIRRKDGSIDPYSSGTFIDANGHSLHLRKNDFILQPQAETWKSTATYATYPIRWQATVPKLGLQLEVTTALKSQEIVGKSSLVPVYWEGAIRVAGMKGSSTIGGVGYLEMTGYDHPIDALR